MGFNFIGSGAGAFDPTGTPLDPASPGGAAILHSELSGIGVSDHHTRYTDAEAVTAIGKTAIQVFAYVGTEPSAAEMAAALTAIHEQGIFKKGDTDPAFFAFRRSIAAGGAAADFSLVELT